MSINEFRNLECKALGTSSTYRSMFPLLASFLEPFVCTAPESVMPSFEKLRTSRRTAMVNIVCCSVTKTLQPHGLLHNSVTPWTAAHQAPLSFLISQSLLKFMSAESVMLFDHLILCRPLLLLPSVFPSIKVFSIWLLASGDQRIGALPLATILPMNIHVDFL